jgi:signal transduction histidine kinase
VIRLEARDGTVREILCNAVPLFDDRGEISGAVCTGTDVTEQLATEGKLRELTAMLEARVADALAQRKILADVVESTDAVVQVVDRDLRWLAINRAGVQMFESMIAVRPKPGDSVLDLLTPFTELRVKVHALWLRALAGEEFTEQTSERGPSGEQRHVEVKFRTLLDQQGQQIGAYQFAYDVTERVENHARLVSAQAQLHEMQKLDTIGQLTGNVAHDFNNLLTPIVGTLDILANRAADQRSQKLVAAALQAADRARTLVQRLLAFARRQYLEARPIAIDELIDGISDLVRGAVGPIVTVKVDLQPSLPPAQVDPNQLELALLNLAVNARDAMPEGGTLTIAAAAETVQQHSSLQPGDYLRITVSDTGTGMDAETLQKAVEPFFTTKGSGKGTGLGLSMVHGLAGQSGGALALRSSPGQGTSASIWLPVSRHQAVPGLFQDGSPIPPRARSESILLVDDEPLVRSATANMLLEAGFQIIEAESGLRALELARAGLHIDCLVTDYAMPGMSGARLAVQLREINPELPVLVITGYASLTDKEVNGLPRLAKPFRQRELIARVIGILDGTNRRPEDPG